MPIQIVIADDHEMYRLGFEVLLRKTESIKIVAHAENGKALFEAVEKYNPDLVLTDIEMPVMDGIESCKLIKEKYPDLPIIALTTYNDDNLIIDMIDAGAEGYLLKGVDKEELINAINIVFEGGTYFTPDTLTKIKKMIGENRYAPHKHKNITEFTEREKEIISLICQSLSSKEIADKVNLSPRTVEGHKTRIQEKMGAKNSIAIVIYAIKHKLFKV